MKTGRGRICGIYQLVIPFRLHTRHQVSWSVIERHVIILGYCVLCTPVLKKSDSVMIIIQAMAGLVSVFPRIGSMDCCNLSRTVPRPTPERADLQLFFDQIQSISHHQQTASRSEVITGLSPDSTTIRGCAMLAASSCMNTDSIN